MLQDLHGHLPTEEVLAGWVEEYLMEYWMETTLQAGSEFSTFSLSAVRYELRNPQRNKALSDMKSFLDCSDELWEIFIRQKELYIELQNKILLELQRENQFLESVRKQEELKLLFLRYQVEELKKILQLLNIPYKN